MPRVHTKTKNRGGKKIYRCSKCRQEIQPGERYYEWSFRYGGSRRQHQTCGYPRQSQLTQSKMSDLYAAVEDVEDTLAVEWTLEDVESGIENVVSEAERIADEYREAADHFGGYNEQSDRADEIENFASTLQSLTLDAYSADDSESEDDWRDRIKSEVESALGEAP